MKGLRDGCKEGREGGVSFQGISVALSDSTFLVGHDDPTYFLLDILGHFFISCASVVDYSIGVHYLNYIFWVKFLDIYNKLI